MSSRTEISIGVDKLCQGLFATLKFDVNYNLMLLLISESIL